VRLRFATLKDVGRNNAGKWAEARVAAIDDGSYSPRELYARAILYSVRGFSARETAAKLREDFPGQKIPHFSQIARWQSHQPANLAGYYKLLDAFHRTGRLLVMRLEQLESDPSQIIEHIDEVMRMREYARSAVEKAKAARYL
jgi:hypothetical protein